MLTYFEHRDEGEAVAQRCLLLGAVSADLLYLDLADDDSLRDCVGQIDRRLGAIDLLVNNAGVVVWRAFSEQTFRDVELNLRVNLEGVLKLTLLCMPLVRQQILMVGSTASLHGSRRLTSYCASKWGLRGFAKALALERPDLRVLSVHPGVTATRMNDFRGMPPERVADVVLSALTGEIEAESGADIDVRQVASDE